MSNVRSVSTFHCCSSPLSDLAVVNSYQVKTREIQVMSSVTKKGVCVRVCAHLTSPSAPGNTIVTNIYVLQILIIDCVEGELYMSHSILILVLVMIGPYSTNCY